MSIRWAWIIPAMTLAACGPKTSSDDHNAAAPAPENQIEQVTSLPDGARDAVFFRAIRDADLPCQKILSATALPKAGSSAQWTVQCEDHVPHLISIPPSGSAIVTSRTHP